MATCTNTHKSTSLVQGPGACCAALAASGQAPAVGVSVAAKNKNGKCFVCTIASSTSKKNPGKLVFKHGKSGNLCPTAASGCCALLV